MRRIKFYFLVVFLSSIITGCDDSNTPEPAENVASVNVGIDQSVIEGQGISLVAAVYPEGGSITWTQVSGTFIDGFPIEDSLAIDLTAPDVTTDTDLIFQASYTSLDGQLVSDQVTVSVTSVNIAPVAVIQMEDDVTPPFPTFETITLSGESSYDSDGEIRTYAWEQVDNGTTLNLLTDSTSATVQYQAPFVGSLTNFQIQLTVTDNYGVSASNVIDVQVSEAQDSIVANAGEDQSVQEFIEVTLDGTESVSSVSDVSCVWSVVSVATVEFTDDEASDDATESSSCEPTFFAPDVDTVSSVVIQLVVTDTDNNTASDQVTITVSPHNLGILHDTGVTECFDNSAVIDCGDSDFPSQDADTGRDNIAYALDKSGEGERGFDFTKFDVNGDELPNDSLVFSCIRDNFTGFIWEVKQAPTDPRFGSLRSVDNYYTMDDSGVALESCSSDEACSVDEYIDTVNEETYCGGANWRLPTYIELLNILDYYDIDQESLLPLDFFQYTPDEAELGHKYYWVSDTSAEGGGDSFNWVIDFATGDDSALKESDFAYIILVRTP